MLEDAQAKNLGITILDHPIARNLVRELRDRKTARFAFSRAVTKLTPLLMQYATADLAEKDVEVETPLGVKVVTQELAEKIILLPILRSGYGMLNAALEFFPDNKISSIVTAGVKRDEANAQPNWYRLLDELEGMDSGADSVFFVLDPMLATGGTATDTIAKIKELYPKARIKMVAMLSAPEGIQKLQEAHPDVDIYTGTLDSHLDERKYIVPGLGDAGDRQFGT
jgi:uracil phosphoribosyltransferase